MIEYSQARFNFGVKHALLVCGKSAGLTDSRQSNQATAVESPVFLCWSNPISSDSHIDILNGLYNYTQDCIGQVDTV